MSAVLIHADGSVYDNQVGELLFPDEEGGFEVAMSDGVHHFERKEVVPLPVALVLSEWDGETFTPIGGAS